MNFRLYKAKETRVARCNSNEKGNQVLAPAFVSGRLRCARRTDDQSSPEDDRGRQEVSSSGLETGVTGSLRVPEMQSLCIARRVGATRKSSVSTMRLVARTGAIHVAQRTRVSTNEVISQIDP